MNEVQYAAPLPYPSLDGLQTNSHDLHLIRSNYAGLTSELSAITQYVYHQLHAKSNHFTGIGQILLAIAQIEMRHLNIFGGMILKLGGNPKFIYHNGCQMAYWNGGMIDDCCQLQAMIQRDIKLEQETILAYKRQGKEVCQPAITAMLNRIILDEEIHIERLKAIKT